MTYELTEQYEDGSKVKKYNDFRRMMGHIYWLIKDNTLAGKAIPIFTILVIG